MSVRESTGRPSSCSGAERFAGRLLVERRRRRTGLDALAQFGEPEVEQLDPRLGEHHVAGFQIAVRDAFAMRARERLRERRRVPEGFVERQRAAG